MLPFESVPLKWPNSLIKNLGLHSRKTTAAELQGTEHCECVHCSRWPLCKTLHAFWLWFRKPVFSTNKCQPLKIQEQSSNKTHSKEEKEGNKGYSFTKSASCRPKKRQASFKKKNGAALSERHGRGSFRGPGQGAPRSWHPGDSAPGTPDPKSQKQRTPSANFAQLLFETFFGELHVGLKKNLTFQRQTATTDMNPRANAKNTWHWHFTKEKLTFHRSPKTWNFTERLKQIVEFAGRPRNLREIEMVRVLSPYHTPMQPEERKT